ncbi:MAG: EthD domain-containing protein [Pseudomonadota bacterium]
MKRMTLLARREGMSTSDFRSYWAGPHGKLALEMEGINRYTQNRVDKVLWSRFGVPAFSVDGIVELWFEGEDAMRRAQASSIGKLHIPADEPNFLRGWTLCLVDDPLAEAVSQHVKVMVPFVLKADADREIIDGQLARLVREVGSENLGSFSLNWTASSARRDRLWAEPLPPTGFAVFWFANLGSAHDAFAADGLLALGLQSLVDEGTAYLVDPLKMR